MLSHSGDLTSATELSRAALDIMLASGESVGIVSASFSLAQALWYSGDLDLARRVLIVECPCMPATKAASEARTATFVLPSVVYFCYLARISEDLGDSAAAFDAIKEASAIASPDTATSSTRSSSIPMKAACCSPNGQQARSIEMLERVLDATRTNKIEWHIPFVRLFSLSPVPMSMPGAMPMPRLLLRARVDPSPTAIGMSASVFSCSPPFVRALAEEDLVAAKGVALATLRDADMRGFRPTVVHTQLALAHIHLSEGRPGGARTVLKEAAALAKEIGLLREELAGVGTALGPGPRQGGQPMPAVARDAGRQRNCGSGLRHSRSSRDLTVGSTMHRAGSAVEPYHELQFLSITKVFISRSPSCSSPPLGGEVGRGGSTHVDAPSPSLSP